MRRITSLIPPMLAGDGYVYLEGSFPGENGLFRFIVFDAVGLGSIVEIGFSGGVVSNLSVNWGDKYRVQY